MHELAATTGRRLSDDHTYKCLKGIGVYISDEQSKKKRKWVINLLLIACWCLLFFSASLSSVSWKFFINISKKCPFRFQTNDIHCISCSRRIVSVLLHIFRF